MKRFVEIDMVGKDSVPATYKVEVPPDVYREFERLLKKKKPEDRVFETDSGKVGAFVKEIDPAFSPKLFRTAIGSKELVEYLKAHRVKKSAPDYEKLDVLKRANLAVSTKLNHRSGIGKVKEIDTSRLDKRIEGLAERAKALKGDPKKADRLAKVLEQKKQVEKMKALKLDVGDISLSTALGSYADPRVVFSWCRDVEFDPAKVYNKGLMALFSWCESVPKTFWKEYP